MLMRDQHLYKSPTIEVYGHCRLLLPLTENTLLILFAIQGCKLACLGWRLNRQPYILVLSQVLLTSQPRQPVIQHHIFLNLVLGKSKASKFYNKTLKVKSNVMLNSERVLKIILQCIWKCSLRLSINPLTS